jgi:hypothetical protein
VYVNLAYMQIACNATSLLLQCNQLTDVLHVYAVIPVAVYEQHQASCEASCCKPSVLAQTYTYCIYYYTLQCFIHVHDRLELRTCLHHQCWAKSTCMIQKGGAVIELICGYALTLMLCIYAGNVCSIHNIEVLLQYMLYVAVTVVSSGMHAMLYHTKNACMLY